MTIERELCERVFTCDKLPAGEIPISNDRVALFPGTRFYNVIGDHDSVRIVVVTVVSLALITVNGKPTVVARGENAGHTGAIGSNTYDLVPGRLFFDQEFARTEMTRLMPSHDAGNVAPFSHWKKKEKA